jgi:hypothetical protein
MKTASLLAFAGSVICFALPAFAQNTADSKIIVQQRDLLRVAKAIDDFGAVSLELEEAFKKNDASAIAALFTEDGILVASDGMFTGRQAIEKRYADIFQRWPITTFSGSVISQIQSTMRFRRSENGGLPFKPRPLPNSKVAIGQRFIIARVTTGRSAC